ncbi:putative Mce family protein [Mycolicibacterium insubricum]|uniref:Mammalian cell entry protein n=1 Tax=Mycolicibacterium insubricum TaxID=444597 RepID=A0A1X0DNB2_9MYCO|nr:MCE family protein [Mycolicibacterium insubricum]MCB9441855.1 MCE family protein [Mycolicibacterium sp.]ORA73868.1 mammalian cell entry protein [Mycolicibacterium insubricum]BBZ67464.1 putative Mce family protein [Mycolicibacterium insubricum]
MSNSFDSNPRGSSNRSLSIIGVCFTMVAVVVAATMVAKSQGKLDDLVRVEIKLVNIGDGLPERSDTKFRGVIVGMVSGVTPSRNGQPNVVRVDLQPDYAARIPNNVTARVVPANIFAVSAVQLVENAGGQRPLHSGDVIEEDQTLPTVLFQNVLAKLRQLLASVGRAPDPNNIGVIAALAEATHGRGQKLTDAGRDLNSVIRELNSVMAPDASGPSTLSAIKAATESLRTASPDLFDALDSSVQPMRTFAEKRSQLTEFLTGGLGTAGTVGDALTNRSDQMIEISTGLTPAIGIITDNSGTFGTVSTKLQTFANKLYDEAWNPETYMITIKAIVAINPTRTYVRADCPRYGAMAGPSCATAPEMPVAPDLRPGLASKGMQLPPWVTENRPNLAPPRYSVNPPAADPAPAAEPAPAPDPAPAQPAQAPAPGPYPADVRPQSAVTYGGTVGPVGSRYESDQLSRIVGGPATSTTTLLLGPLTRGTHVEITPVAGGPR